MSNRLDLLSQWTRYKPGLCQTCQAHCCTLPLEVTVSDLVLMELISEDEANLSFKKIAKLLSKQRLIKTTRATTGLFMLEQKPNGDCLFLDSEGRCKIYEKRPSVCRNFPTKVGPKINYCPYEKK